MDRPRSQAERSEAPYRRSRQESSPLRGRVRRPDATSPRSRSPPGRSEQGRWRERAAGRSRSPARAPSPSDRRPNERLAKEVGARHRGDWTAERPRRRERRGEEETGKLEWGRPEHREEDRQPDVTVDANFGLSGLLAAESNTVNGVVLVYSEPAEAALPRERWRLYVFKGGEALPDPLHIHRQSSYLFGRERRVADVPADHPSCSKQHCVVQFRSVERERADGMLHQVVRPYVMDLGSVNGTFLNEKRLEPQRYYELLEKDTLRLGSSSRDYVLLHDRSHEGDRKR